MKQETRLTAAGLSQDRDMFRSSTLIQAEAMLCQLSVFDQESEIYSAVMSISSPSRLSAGYAVPNPRYYLFDKSKHGFWALRSPNGQQFSKESLLNRVFAFSRGLYSEVGRREIEQHPPRIL